jgi:CBS domain-containing protein
MKTAERMMTSKVLTVGPRDTLSKAKALMDSGNFRHVPVVKNGKLIGILSDRDLRSHVGHLESTRVDAAMTPNPVPTENLKPDVLMMQPAEDWYGCNVADLLGPPKIWSIFI